MTLPALLFGITLAALYGSLFHLWKGGNPARLLADLLIAEIGFWAGHSVAAIQHWQWGTFGVLHLFTATAGSVLLLMLGDFLLPPQDKSSH